MNNNLNNIDGWKRHIGILAYGSLIQDPGPEIQPLILERISTQTPFPVEYARLSKKRGGGPTVVPHHSGKPVKAKILVLNESVSLRAAQDLLWRREVGKAGSRKRYPAGTSPDSVIIGKLANFEGLECVLYTDFPLAGKNAPLDPDALALCAINSVSRASRGNDGISYLIQLSESGVKTPLTNKYTAIILGATRTSNLREALASLQNRIS